ncbi:MAG: hypothetical protein QM691_00650 [Opitutaceae bacterium]
MHAYQSYPSSHPAIHAAGLNRFRGNTWWVEFTDGVATRAIGKNSDGRHTLLDLQQCRIERHQLQPTNDAAGVRQEFEHVWTELARRYKNEGDEA